MNADDDDKLWDLLGRAKEPSVSPFFSRNVLRAVRQQPAHPVARTVRALFPAPVRRWSWRVGLLAACVAATLATLLPSTFLHLNRQHAIHSALAGQVVGNPDYEVIKNLDELVADEESSVWLDDSVN